MKLEDKIDDATRSRLANLKRRIDPISAKKNLYAIFDKTQTLCIVVVATCAEEALELCHQAGCGSWTLHNTVCRSIMRNIDEEESALLTAVKMKR